MTDKEILRKLGISDTDATDLAQKMAGLNPEQLGVMDGATADIAKAAAKFGPDCSPEDLQRFLDARKGYQPGVAGIYFGPQGEPD
jgi:hypothetical protein